MPTLIMKPLKDLIPNSGTKKATTPITSLNDGEDVCPICYGQGVVSKDVPVGHPDFGRAFPCVCQQTHVSERRERVLRKLSNLNAYAKYQFANFRIDETARHAGPLQIAFQSAVEFAENPSGWLFFQGGYGSGKTHLAAAIGNYRLEGGHPVIFSTAPDLLDHLRSSYTSQDYTYDELFEKLRNVELLVIDDLGTESPTEWALEKLYQLLNHRYVMRLPTIITTNHDLDELEGRIRSRLMDKQVVRHISMNVPDHRSDISAYQMRTELSTLRHYASMTFHNFQWRYPQLNTQESKNLREAHEKAFRYAQAPSGWFFLHGKHGCGKTHLAAAIANHCQAHGVPTIIVTTADLIDYLRASFEQNAQLSFDRRFNELKQFPLLILDDFRTTTASPWAREKLYQLIDHRYLGLLPTVFTLLEGTAQEHDDRFEARFKDYRLCHHVVVDGPSFLIRTKPG